MSLRKCSPGNTTLDIRESLIIPDSKPLADFLPPKNVATRNFANKLTVVTIHKGDLLSAILLPQV